jgi:hypothetical protein
MKTKSKTPKPVKKQSTKKNNKKKYRIRNWKEYNESLKQRGKIEVWLDQNILDNWYNENDNPKEEKRKQGAQPIYTDDAVNLTLQFGKVFDQRLRQTEGLVISIFESLKIELDVPDYSTLSRRGEKIEVKIPKTNKNEGLAIIADSSGLKVFGDGEWKVRKHGYSKRRTWRKFHIGVTRDGEIRATELTDNSVADNEIIPDLLNQEKETINEFSGDGAYDKRNVYDYLQKRKVDKILVPPQKNAKIWKHGNCKSPPHPRDENLRQIRKTSRKRWKEFYGYHIRSLSENVFFRFKTIFGDKLHARKFANQITETKISAVILNKMASLGMPNSYAIT